MLLARKSYSYASCTHHLLNGVCKKHMSKICAQGLWPKALRYYSSAY